MAILDFTLPPTCTPFKFYILPAEAYSFKLLLFIERRLTKVKFIVCHVRSINGALWSDLRFPYDLIQSKCRFSSNWKTDRMQSPPNTL